MPETIKVPGATQLLLEAVIGGGANQPDVPSPAPRARALTLRFG